MYRCGRTWKCFKFRGLRMYREEGMGRISGRIWEMRMMRRKRWPSGWQENRWKKGSRETRRSWLKANCVCVCVREKDREAEKERPCQRESLNLKQHKLYTNRMMEIRSNIYNSNRSISRSNICGGSSNKSIHFW